MRSPHPAFHGVGVGVVYFTSDAHPNGERRGTSPFQFVEHPLAARTRGSELVPEPLVVIGDERTVSGFTWSPSAQSAIGTPGERFPLEVVQKQPSKLDKGKVVCGSIFQLRRSGRGPVLVISTFQEGNDFRFRIELLFRDPRVLHHCDQFVGATGVTEFRNSHGFIQSGSRAER